MCIQLEKEICEQERKFEVQIGLSPWNAVSQITDKTILMTHSAVFSPQGPFCGRPLPYQNVTIVLKWHMMWRNSPPVSSLGISKDLALIHPPNRAFQWLWKCYLILLIFAGSGDTDQNLIPGHKWLLFSPLCYPRTLIIRQVLGSLGHDSTGSWQKLWPPPHPDLNLLVSTCSWFFVWKHHFPKQVTLWGLMTQP